VAEIQDQTLAELGDYIASALPNEVTTAEVAYHELNIETAPANILRVLRFLREDSSCRFLQLIDLCGVDYPERSPRFDVVYHLLSLHQNHRIRVRVKVDDGTALPSAIDLFPTANWFEREAFDMYGILFSGHPDLRRILTDYGFDGHPLRKDFPLTGFVEVRYDEEERRVVYEPVKLVQEFRSFDFLSPWEGAKYILPGDEKAGEAKKS
jgi:NADH-quinone oxidoreductase subunit C